MNKYYDLYILLVFICFSYFITLGGLALSVNPKDNANRIFSVVCFVLSIWVGGALLSSISSNHEEALIWRRISSIGWGTLYSILVHFSLELCEEKVLLKKKWIYFIIYTPAIISILIFCLIPYIAIQQYSLVFTDLGWINIVVQNTWDIFFNIYYISYSITVLIILFRWGFIHNIHKKRQAVIIILSFLSAIFLGTITERYLSGFVKIPSLSPFFIAIPISFIFYWIKKNSFMSMIIKPDNKQIGKILNNREEIKVYKYLSLIFFFSSMTSLFRYFFHGNPGIEEMKFSLVTAILGVLVYYLPTIIKDSFHRNNIMTPIMNISVVLMMVHFSNISSDRVNWPFPFLIILVSIVFNKIHLLLSIYISAVFANILVWYLEDIPFNIIFFPEYVPRFLFLTFGTFLALIINKIYLNRLKEHEEQILIQGMISSISSKFVSININNTKERFTSILEELGTHYHSNNASLILFSNKEQIITDYFEWFPERESFEYNLTDDYSWCIERLQNNEIISINDKNKDKNFIAVPVSSKDDFLGMLVLKFNGTTSLLTNADIKEVFRILTNLIADALIKIDNEKKINTLAYFDSLTNLANRTLFHDRLENAISLAKRESKLVAVMMMDLDSFKYVNDSMGHDAGDQLLKVIADRLSANIRGYDTVSRFGGDEFMFILSQIKESSEAAKVAVKLLTSIAKPIRINNEEIYITGSIGITLYPNDTDKLELLIKNSDLAMYASKKLGKNCHSFYSLKLKENTHEKMRLISDLNKALDRDEFVVHYQPQVQLETKKIIGMEALIRWNHPKKGLINPDVFIPLAEETGLISSIGKWVLYTACKHNKSLQNRGLPHICVAVNLSVKQFNNENLVNMIQEILTETQLSPKYLELEITESLAISDASTILNPLNKLRDLGISISIDDFGTEYSSLSRLNQMPIDRIKIDKQFIEGLTFRKSDESITNFIVELSKNMGVKVIAEGVETDTQLSFLADICCDEIQGYYFYKPMCFDDINKVLASY